MLQNAETEQSQLAIAFVKWAKYLWELERIYHWVCEGFRVLSNVSFEESRQATRIPAVETRNDIEVVKSRLDNTFDIFAEQLQNLTLTMQYHQPEPQLAQRNICSYCRNALHHSNQRQENFARNTSCRMYHKLISYNSYAMKFKGSILNFLNDKKIPITFEKENWKKTLQ